MGTRRRLTPEYRRDVASLALDTGSSIASLAMGFLHHKNPPAGVSPACRGSIGAIPPPFGGGVIGKQVAPGPVRAL